MGGHAHTFLATINKKEAMDFTDKKVHMGEFGGNKREGGNDAIPL